MVRKSVQGGYCNWPDTFGCALTNLQCDDPNNFLSSRQMQNGPVRAHGGSCRWQDSVRETVLGRCNENGVATECAPDIAACPSGNSFDGAYGQQAECIVETTSFGRCDYGMCAWSHVHCYEDNTWEAFDEGCTCDRVQVGACSHWKYNERETYCAVSKDACDDLQSWITPQEVMGAAGFDCFLCREVSPPSTTNDVASNTKADDVAQISGIKTQASAEATVKAAAGIDTQTIFMFSVVAGVVIALLIIGLVGWRVFREKRAVKRAIGGGFASEQGPPTMAIEVSENIGNDFEAGNSMDMDNTSVLSDE